MKSTVTNFVLVALSLLLTVGFAHASDNNVKTPQLTSSKAMTNSKSEPNEESGKRKVTATSKLVDINSATKKDLKTLPGITDDEATKIIAGRPYGSKTWIVGPNALTETKYMSIKDKIIAKQPFKDAAKNAALYVNKK